MLKVNVTVFLSEELLSRARAEAEGDGRSVSNFIEKLLRERYHPGSTAALPVSDSPFKPMRQIDLADQIARKVKAGPIRKKR